MLEGQASGGPGRSSGTRNATFGPPRSVSQGDTSGIISGRRRRLIDPRARGKSPRETKVDYFFSNAAAKGSGPLTVCVRQTCPEDIA